MICLFLNILQEPIVLWFVWAQGREGAIWAEGQVASEISCLPSKYSWAGVKAERSVWQETNTEQRSARVRDFDPFREKASDSQKEEKNQSS